MIRTLALALILLLGDGLACGYPDPAIHARVVYWARAYGLDPLFLGAVVWVESRYCTQALSPKGARGLGQVMPATAQGMGVPGNYLYHPDWNLMASSRYLRTLWMRYRDWQRVLWAYNAGPGRVDRDEVPLSTKRYAEEVFMVYRYWKKKGGR